MVRIEGRTAAHGQDRPGVRVHDQHGGAGGIRPLHGVIQRILDDKLHLAVDGQVDCSYHCLFFGLFRISIFIGNDPSHGIGLDGLPRLRSLEDAVQGQLQPGQTAVVGAYEAKHLGCHGFLGIIAFAFRNKMQSGQFIFFYDRNDLLVILRFQHALDPDKLPLQRKIFIQRCLADVQDRRQLLSRDSRNIPEFPGFPRFGAFIHLIRIDIKGMDHDADGQFFPVPVHDTAPWRVPFDLFRNLGHSALSQLRAADDLYP